MSFKVIVMVEVATLLAMTGPEPVMVEFAATATPAEKRTVPPDLTTGVAIERVLVSAFFELNVQVDIPNESVTEQRLVSLVVPVSVAEKVGVWPATGLLKRSFKVIVTVEVEVPLATTGLVPVMVELAATALVDEKVTALPVTAIGEVNCSVFTSAVVDARVQTESPLAFDTEQSP
jgi:hypothetical protein